MNPKSPNQCLYLRAIQGHLGETPIDPALHDNILISKGFTEYLHHVGNANELNSTRRNGLIPGGTSLKRGRQAVFFTPVNLEDGYGLGQTLLRSDKTKDHAIQEYLETLSKYNILVQFGAGPRERTAVFPNAVACSRF